MKQQERVKFFNTDKDYGFIKTERRRTRYFRAYYRAAERAGLQALSEGQRVTYEIEANILQAV